MAKIKKTTKKKATSEQPPEKQLPTVVEGDLTFVLTRDEVFSLIQILSFSRDVFKQMSLDRAVEGDVKSEAAYAARSQLSELLFTKIRQIASIGEPTSRAFH